MSSRYFVNSAEAAHVHGGSVRVAGHGVLHQRRSVGSRCRSTGDQRGGVHATGRMAAEPGTPPAPFWGLEGATSRAAPSGQSMYTERRGDCGRRTERILSTAPDPGATCSGCSHRCWPPFRSCRAQGTRRVGRLMRFLASAPWGRVFPSLDKPGVSGEWIRLQLDHQRILASVIGDLPDGLMTIGDDWTLLTSALSTGSLIDRRSPAVRPGPTSPATALDAAPQRSDTGRALSAAMIHFSRFDIAFDGVYVSPSG